MSSQKDLSKNASKKRIVGGNRDAVSKAHRKEKEARSKRELALSKVTIRLFTQDEDFYGNRETEDDLNFLE